MTRLTSAFVAVSAALEMGHVDPTPDQIEAVARALDVDVAALHSVGVAGKTFWGPVTLCEWV